MANDEFRSPATVPTPTQAMHPTTKQYVDAAVAGASGTSTLRGATDYDNTTPPTDGQVIAWLNSASKFRPLTITPSLIGAATTADLSARALDSAVVHNTGNESIGGQKTIPAGAGNQWIFNIAPQIAVGTLANQPVRRDDARVTADQAAGTASIRTIGTGALQAASGSHVHTPAPPPGWVNVKDYGALGNNVADDTTAIQAALNATTAGGICYVPPGIYRTSAPLIVPPNITLLGAHVDTLSYTSALANPTSIKALSGFTGRALLRVLDKTTGGYSADAVGTRIREITIDGSGTVTAGVAGVELYGFVREFTADHVTVRGVPGDGFATTGYGSYTGDARPPQSLRWEHCVADNPGGAGFVLSGCPDSTLIDCNAQGAGYVGYYIAGAQNSIMSSCRAEWSDQQNYLVTGGNWGTGQGSGGLMMFGCMSDRAGYDGVKIDSTGSAAHNITGMMCRRDGRNNGTGGGGYAAINATGATTPVIITGLTVYPGVDDDGAGTNSPQIGVVATNSTHVQVVSGYIHVATTPVGAGSGNGWFSVTPEVGLATGPTATPTRLPIKLTPPPTIVTLATIATGNININAAAGSLHRITVTGATATLTVPTNPIDGDVVNVEVFASTVLTTLTIAAAILETTGILPTVAIPAGKRWFGALRHINGVGWIVLASSVLI